MGLRFPQVKRLTTVAAFRSRLDELGLDLPVDDTVDPAGILASPVTIQGGGRTMTVPNRFAVLPMEGWDGTVGGHPSDLVRRRWRRFAESGAGLVWGEATAVREDGRANPQQLRLDERTVDSIAELRKVLAPNQVAGLQLTHSGRWSRPGGEARPKTAYSHPLLDERAGATGGDVLSDDELDELVVCFVDAAVLAADAGFDFVDIKHCHGYLLHELLSAYDRPGRYGGDFEGRTRFLRSVVAGIREHVPDLALAVRLSVFDFVPFVEDENGVGTPAGTQYSYAFGGDGTGVGIDLTEAHLFLDLLAELGIGLVCTTAGSPYYNPHIQRPAYFPPSDGYVPPEDPLVGVARQVAATAELADAQRDITVVGSGYSYLQEWVGNVAQPTIASGGASMLGLGRMMLSYPQLPADILAGRPLNGRLICRTFSDCTTAPRNGLVSGCFPLDPFYKEHPQRAELARAKKTARVRDD